MAGITFKISHVKKSSDVKKEGKEINYVYDIDVFDNPHIKC